MSKVTRRPSRLKTLATENGSLRSGKGARPQGMEGKRHRNQNGQRKLEQGSINSQGVQRSAAGPAHLVGSHQFLTHAITPPYRLPHPRHPPPLIFLCVFPLPTLPSPPLSPRPTPPSPPTHVTNPFLSGCGHIVAKSSLTPHSACSSHAG